MELHRPRRQFNKPLPHPLGEQQALPLPLLSKPQRSSQQQVHLGGRYRRLKRPSREWRQRLRRSCLPHLRCAVMPAAVPHGEVLHFCSKHESGLSCGSQQELWCSLCLQFGRCVHLCTLVTDCCWGEVCSHSICYISSLFAQGSCLCLRRKDSICLMLKSIYCTVCCSQALLAEIDFGVLKGLGEASQKF